VAEAAFSPDGRELVVVDTNRPAAQIWDVRTAKRVGAPMPKASRDAFPLSAAQFLSNPPRILTVDVLGTVRVSDPTTRTSATLPGAAFPAAVSATADGRIALGTQEGLLRFFPANGRPAPPKKVTDKGVSSLEFSPAGGAIALGGQAGTASIWRTRTLTGTVLRAFGGQITGTTVSPGGDFVLVTSESTARLWDRSLRRVIAELPGTGDVRGEFSPDGTRIVIAGAKRLEVLPCIPCLPQQRLEEKARSLLPAR
jgi:WD40 repeat protein